MGFATDMTAWAKKTKLTADQAVRTVGIEMYKQLTDAAPVDSGQFRLNWNVSVGSVDTTTKPLSRQELNKYATARRQGTTLSPHGFDPQKAVTGFAGVVAGQTMYISNAMPYALRLAFGWSEQAYGGWVSRAVERVRRGLV